MKTSSVIGLLARQNLKKRFHRNNWELQSESQLRITIWLNHNWELHSESQGSEIPAAPVNVISAESCPSGFLALQRKVPQCEDRPVVLDYKNSWENEAQKMLEKHIDIRQFNWNCIFKILFNKFRRDEERFQNCNLDFWRSQRSLSPPGKFIFQKCSHPPKYLRCSFCIFRSQVLT